MSTPYKLGENHKLYYSATAAASLSFTIPATVADNVMNVKSNWKRDQPEFTTRANGGVKQYGVSLVDPSISWEHKVPGVGATDAAFAAFRDAAINGTEILLADLDGDSATTNSQGPAGNWTVSMTDRDGSNGKVTVVAFEAKPSSYNKWYIAPGS